MRYIELLSADGRLLAGALYDYFIVDLAKRRPMRPEKILNPAMKGELPPPYPDLAPGVPDAPGFAGGAPEGWTEAFTMKVGPRHIDYNGHVNNAHFIDWLCDAVPAEKRGSGRAARIKVDFVSEVKAGEEVAAYWADGARSGGDGSALGGAHSIVASGDRLSLLLRGTEVVAKALTRWA
jgi:medium-chain acyl-[acyl-carrier-protein] hydrolase